MQLTPVDYDPFKAPEPASDFTGVPQLQKGARMFTPEETAANVAAEQTPEAKAGYEKAFQEWYADRAKRTGLNPNPDDPQHFYDYRAAFDAGAEPGKDGHWPSQFKREGHPNLVIDGVNTKTGESSKAKLTPVDYNPFEGTAPESIYATPKAETAPKSQSKEITKGFVSGLIDANPKLAGNAMQMFGELFDADWLKQSGTNVEKYGEQGSKDRAARVPSFTNIRTDSAGNFLSDLGDYAGYQLGAGVGTSVPSLATGIGATFLTENPFIGLAVGAMGPSYIQNAGDAYSSIKESKDIQARIASGELTQKQAAKIAAIAGVPMAALDVLSLEAVLGSAFKSAKQNLLKRVITGFLTGGLVEGGTEGLQEVISLWSQDYLGDNTPMRDRVVQVLDNVFGGMAAGSVMGAGAKAVQRGEPPEDVQPPQTGDVPISEMLGTPESEAPVRTMPPNESVRAGVATAEDTGKEALFNVPPNDGAPPPGGGRAYPLKDKDGRSYRIFVSGGVADANEKIDPFHPDRIYAPAAPAPKPISTIPGSATTFSTERGAKIDGQYALVDADTLIASHDATLKENPAYPKELQPRDRSRAASELQVARIAGNLQPSYLGESPMASQGAPIIGEDGVVESGNARTIALKRVYAKDGAPQYKEWLKVNAAKFGFPAEAVDQMAQPILVRVRQTPVNRAEFARQANESSVAQMSPVELAKMDASRVGSLDDLKLDESGDFLSPVNRPFIRRFIGSLPVTEQAALVTETGELSQAGYARVRNAILARAYGDTGPLMRIVESMDDNIRNVTKALIRTAPMVAKVRDSIAQGALHDRDITGSVVRAVEEFSRLRAAGQTVGQMLAQSQMFGSDISPEVISLLQFLEQNSRSPKAIASFIENYLSVLESVGNPNQAGMFDAGPAPTTGELIDQAKRKTNEQGATGVPEGEPAASIPAGVAAAIPVAASPSPVSEPARPVEEGAGRPGSAASSAEKPAEQPKSSVAAEVAAARKKTATPAPIVEIEDSVLSLEPSVAQAAAAPTNDVDAELQDALADLGEWFDANVPGKASMLPMESRQKLVPILARLFSAAIKKGYKEFKTASRWVIEQLQKDAKARALIDFMPQEDLTADMKEAFALAKKSATPVSGDYTEVSQEASGAQAAAVPAVRQQLFVERGGKRFPVDSLEDAARKWDQFRDASGAGVSEVGNGARIVDQNGKEIGRISYNGKVWPPGEWKSGMKPLVGENFKPSAPAIAAEVSAARENAEWLKVWESLPEKMQDELRQQAAMPHTIDINTPERIALRKRIADEMYGEGAKVKGKRLDVVMGLSASGKSSMRAEPLAKEHGSLLIDSDAVKEMLPEFNNGMGANAMHEESSRIAKDLLVRAVEAGDNLVYPTVGSTLDSLRAFIVYAKERGYTVNLTFVDVSFDTALKRLVSRWEHTGRLVDPGFLFLTRKKSKANFDILVNEGVPDAHETVENEAQKTLAQSGRAGAAAATADLRPGKGRGQDAPGRSEGAEGKVEKDLAQTPAQAGVSVSAPKKSPVDAAAHEAATSPHNDKPDPSIPQIEAGNYEKGHVRINGLDITIENPAGSVRSGQDRHGNKWSITLKSHYGYIRGTIAADSTPENPQQIDILVKEGTPEDYDGEVYVVDQNNGANRFDEHKVMAGWGRLLDAENGYFENYSKDWPRERVRNISLTTVAGLKKWFAEGDTKKPFAEWRDSMQVENPDFSTTFPMPLDGDIYNTLDETPFGEEQESMKIIHGEQAAELAGYLSDLDAVRTAWENGTTINGTKPKTPSQAEKVREKLQEEMDSLPDQYQDALAAYGDAFGVQAMDAFDAAVRTDYERLKAGQAPLLIPMEWGKLGANGSTTVRQQNEARNGEKPASGGKPADVSGSGPLGVGVAGKGQKDGSSGDLFGPSAGTGQAGESDNLGLQSGGGEQRPSGQRDSGTERHPDRTLETPADAGVSASAPSNYTITPSDKIGDSGAKTKARQNIAAIRIIKDLEKSRRPATPTEQSQLVKYVGWGGIKPIFDEGNEDWAKERADLKSLLTADEFASARRSILDAHYTSETVVGGIYDALKHFGFDGGRILEPSMGVGHFFGLMPPEIRGRSSLSGVEYDPITGAIAKALYPIADISAPRGFQDINVPEGHFDAAVGNPPFGDQSLFDKENKDISKFSIHNFFFAKSVKSLRPGGVLAMVVSNYFMDARTSVAREWISKHAKLLGAIRLPNNAFKGNAGTEVTTDIIFLQKLESGETSSKDWVDVKDIPDPAGGEVMPLNRYFVDHPEMMLGTMKREGTMYAGGTPALIATPGQELGAALGVAVARLPKDVFVPIKRDMAQLTDPETLVPDTVRVNGFFLLPDGKIARRTPDVLDKRQHVAFTPSSEMSAARIKSMINVRDTFRKLMRAEIEDNTAKIEPLRQLLNVVYDSHVKKYGYMNSLGNRRAFDEDPDAPFLEGLEKDYDPGISAESAKKKGVEPKKPSATKAAIFTRRVQSPYRAITHANTPADALSASLAERGRVDLEYMAQIASRPVDVLKRELEGVMYEDPEHGWVTADDYLSGNVKEKLVTAKKAAQDNHRFAVNVSALEKVQPTDIEAVDIGTRFGSHWIPATDYADFIHSLIGVRPVSMHYVRAVSKWFVDIPFTNTTQNRDEWGAMLDGKGWSADKIMEAMLTFKPIRIRENVGTRDEPQYIDLEQETAAARQKADAIEAKFGDWVFQDKERRDRLARFYNDTFNTDVERKWDGSHLTLPGTNPAVQLTENKLHSAWRIIQTNNVLLDHVVGSGKTFTAASGVMELRRLGLIRKAMFVVPNHIVRQWRDEFYTLYPNANILVATEDDFTKDNRQRLFARIATGDWDAVIVAHSSFGKVPMPKVEAEEIMNEQVNDLTEAIEEIKRSSGERNILRDMEKIKEKLINRIKARADEGSKDASGVDFGELGIDALVVDEMHEFKNLYYYSQMQGVTGLGNPEGSNKAFDMFVKIRYLQKRNGRIITATGTPVSNSLVEMFNMQRYMDYDRMKAQGIHHLDAWAGVYGDIKQVWEVHPSGNGYRLSNRFSKFSNLPELITSYRGFADILTLRNLKKQFDAQGKRYPVPKVMGGRPKLHIAPRSPLQTEFFGIPQFKRDEEGNILFARDMDDGDVVSREEWRMVFSLGKEKDEERWPLNREPFAIVDKSQWPKEFFKTREEAKAELQRQRNEPMLEYNEESILWKFENLRELTRESEGKINALSITNEARKAGLDFRLINGDASDFSGSKINKSVEEILRIYHKWSDDKGTQLVFIDLSTPKGAKPEVAAEDDGSEGIDMDELLAGKSTFSVYEDIKAKLLARGIPASEVVFIHDAKNQEQKRKLFARVNSGEVRILIGSTKKMGAGTNVQKRLVGLHHLDAPWRPSDLEQREGRIIRQGNDLYNRDPEGFEVEIHRYATEKSYDTRMWQIIEHKASAIEQLRSGMIPGREMDDVAGEAANSADMKAAASGNPLLEQEIKLRDSVKKLEMQAEAHRRTKFSQENRIALLESAPKRHAEQRKHLERFASAVQPKPEKGFVFTVEGGQKVAEYADLNEPVLSVMKQAINSPDNPVKIGTYRGLTVFMLKPKNWNQVSVLIGTNSNQKEAASGWNYGPEDKFSASGFITRLDNFAGQFPAEIEDVDRRIAADKAELDKAKVAAAQPFDKEQELSDTRSKHVEVLQKLQASGGAIELSPEMRAELDAARAKRNGRNVNEPTSEYSAEKSPIFYSELTAQIAGLKLNAAPAEQWKATISGLTQKGVKAAEIEAVGLNDWLDLQEGKVTKAAVLDFVRNNGVRVTETMLSNEIADALPEGWEVSQSADGTGFILVNADGEIRGEGETEREAIENAQDEGARAETPGTPKFSQYQLPGGENYRELLLTLPEKLDEPGKYATYEEWLPEQPWYQSWKSRGADEAEARRLYQQWFDRGGYPPEKKRFQSSHFDQPNILAHIRFNERTDAEGKRVLFIEELQSDWAQKVRKERERKVKALAESKGITVDEANKLVAPDAGFGGHPVFLEGMEGQENGFMGLTVGPPKAPFVGKTDAWLALSLKRIIRYAAENGFDKIAWTRGEQQVERYTSDLRKAVDVIEWTKTPEGVQLVGYKGKGGTLPPMPQLLEETGARIGKASKSDPADWKLTWRDGSESFYHTKANAEEAVQNEARKNRGWDMKRDKVVDTTEKEDALSDAIGKSMADRIRNDPNQKGTIEGENISVSDTGMAGFYNRIVPSVAKEVLKKLGGGKVGDVHLGKVKGDKVGAEEGTEIRQAAVRFMRGDISADELNEYTGLDMSYEQLDGMLAARSDNRADQQRIATAFLRFVKERIGGQKQSPQHGFDITPEMREKAMKGMALFQPALDYNLDSIDRVYDDAEVRPGTTDKQKSLGIQALRGLFAQDRRAGATLLGSRLWKDFIERKGTELKGAKAAGPRDLARLAQILRDPRFETFRVFFTKDNVIVGHTGITSRLPGVVQIANGDQSAKDLYAELSETMKRFGADGYWMLHNHPNGKATPSRADQFLTIDLAKQVSGFRGHVVIDQDEFAHIKADGAAMVDKIASAMPVPEMAHDAVGMQIASPDDLVRVGKTVQAKKGFATIISRGGPEGRVSAIAEIPESLLASKTAGGQLRAIIRLRRFAKMTGGSDVFVVAEDPDSLKYLTQNGAARDVINRTGSYSAVRQGTDFGSKRKAKYKPFVLRVDQPGANYTAAQRVEQILAKRSPSGAILDAALRIPTQALRLDRITSGAYDKLLNLLGGFVPEKVKAGVVSDYGIPEAVTDRRAEMFGHMRKGLRETENTLQRLTMLTRAESRVAYEWLNNRNADNLLEGLPEDSRTVLREVKALISNLGKEAVRLGQLSKETYEANDMAYIHRSYKKYDIEATDRERTERARAIKILGEQYKGRGLVDEVAMPHIGSPDWWQKKLKGGRADTAVRNNQFLRLERRENRAENVADLPGFTGTGQLGRLKETHYWPAGVDLPAKYQEWHEAGTWTARNVNGNKVVMWRDFTKEEREKMGEIDEARYAIAKTLHQMLHDLEAGRYLEWLANTQAKPEPPGKVVSASESMSTSFAPGTWVQVPESTIPGTKVHKYGKLAGLYLPGPIWNDVRQVVNVRYQPLGEAFADVMRMWKISKTAMSPAVHMNNVMANVVMADWHDVRAVHLMKALKVLIGKDPANKEILARFEDAGGTQGMYVLSEIQREQLAPMIDQLRKEIANVDEATGMARAASILQMIMSGKLRQAAAAVSQTKSAALTMTGIKKLVDMYQEEDTLFRLAAFLKAKEEGATDAQAGKVARKSFLDYQINAPWIQMMRQTAFPFVSFVYRAAPMLLETAARKPWKIMKLAMIVGVANAIGYALSGGDEDKERKLLPEEKAGRVWGMVPKLVRMPWNDGYNQPVFMDIRRFIPVGDVFDLGQTHSAIPILPAAVPGGPLAVLAELLFNQSQFTGREITQETDTAMETAKKVSGHLYKAMAPNLPMLPGTYSFDALLNAGGGRTDVFGREQSLGQAAASSIGLKLGSYPPDVLRQQIVADYKGKDAQIQANIRKLIREYQRKGITDEEFKKKIAEQTAKRQKLAASVQERVQ